MSSSLIIYFLFSSTSCANYHICAENSRNKNCVVKVFLLINQGPSQSTSFHLIKFEYLWWTILKASRRPQEIKWFNLIKCLLGSQNIKYHIVHCHACCQSFLILCDLIVIIDNNKVRFDMFVSTVKAEFFRRIDTVCHVLLKIEL